VQQTYRIFYNLCQMVDPKKEGGRIMKRVSPLSWD